MQIESLLKQSTRVGLENAESLANFLVTWGGESPASAQAMAIDGEESAPPLNADEISAQPDPSAESPVGSGRAKRQAVKPGLPPRVARWEQMQGGPSRGGAAR